jgi:hypothetical protein
MHLNITFHDIEKFQWLNLSFFRATIKCKTAVVRLFSENILYFFFINIIIIGKRNIVRVSVYWNQHDALFIQFFKI